MGNLKFSSEKPYPLPESAAATFGAVMRRWLTFISAERKHSTYIKYKNICGNYLMPFSDLKLVDRYMEEAERLLCLSLKGKSCSLRKNVYTVFNQILKYAREYCGSEIKFKAASPKGTGRVRVEIFSQSEQARLLRYLSAGTDIYKAGILLCLSTGLRLGEICSLKWSDIDMDMRILHVNSTVQRIEARGHETKTILMESEPKSIYSKREIPLSDAVIAMLKNMPRKGRYFLCAGRPMEPRTYQNKLKSYLKSAGVDGKNFHTLRHTFATNCVNTGADIKSISEILGHADVKITLNRYVHPTIDTKRSHMNRLSALYDQITE